MHLMLDQGNTWTDKDAEIRQKLWAWICPKGGKKKNLGAQTVSCQDAEILFNHTPSDVQTDQFHFLLTVSHAYSLYVMLSWKSFGGWMDGSDILIVVENLCVPSADGDDECVLQSPLIPGAGKIEIKRARHLSLFWSHYGGLLLTGTKSHILKPASVSLVCCSPALVDWNLHLFRISHPGLNLLLPSPSGSPPWFSVLCSSSLGQRRSHSDFSPFSF